MLLPYVVLYLMVGIIASVFLIHRWDCAGGEEEMSIVTMTVVGWPLVLPIMGAVWVGIRIGRRMRSHD